MLAFNAKAGAFASLAPSIEPVVRCRHSKRLVQVSWNQQYLL